MVGVFRRQQIDALAVERRPIEVPEIRIAPLLAADADEIQHPVLLVDAQQLRDVALAAGDRVLQPAALQIVEIQVAPVVAFREPDDLVRGRQIAPVDLAVARLEKRRDALFHQVAHDAARRVGDAELFVRCDRATSTRTPAASRYSHPTARPPIRRRTTRRRTAWNDVDPGPSAGGSSCGCPRR